MKPPCRFNKKRVGFRFSFPMPDIGHRINCSSFSIKDGLAILYAESQIEKFLRASSFGAPCKELEIPCLAVFPTLHHAPPGASERRKSNHFR